MSELLEQYRGFATVERHSPPGMIALKGKLSDPALGPALQDTLGAALPEPRRWSQGAGGRVLWMAPDELLLMVPDAAAVLAGLQDRLASVFVTLTDTSDIRAMFKIRGIHSRDTLAKLAPVDFSDFSTGTLRRTRLAQTAALIWCEGPNDWGILCFRSVADYTFALLRTAARPGGEVGLYR